MTKKEAAAYLGVSERSINNYVSEGKLTERRGGRTSLSLNFDETEVEALKASMAPASTTLNRATVQAKEPRKIETGMAKVEHGNLANPETSNLANNVTFYLLTEEQVKEIRGPEVRLSEMPFLTFAQAHRLFNVPEQHLRDAVKAGELKAVKQGRAQQVRAKDVEAWRNSKFEN